VKVLSVFLMIMICHNFYLSIVSRDVVSCQSTDLSLLLAVNFNSVVSLLCSYKLVYLLTYLCVIPVYAFYFARNR